MEVQMPRIGVIAVGGKGSRFEAKAVQKCLIPVDGKPMFWYAAEALRKNGVKCLVLLSGYLHNQVADYVTTTNLGFQTLAVVYGGIGGENAALKALKGLVTDDFLYMAGDCLMHSACITDLIRDAERRHDAVAVVAASKYLHGAFDHARPVVEKATGNLVDVKQAIERETRRA